MHLVGFIIRKFIMMHGHMNVKNLFNYIFNGTLKWFRLFIMSNGRVINEQWINYTCFFHCVCVYTRVYRHQ